ncbi:hypothetical protein RB595_010761 [Gaeumannomyces hyphopodioides]
MDGDLQTRFQPQQVEANCWLLPFALIFASAVSFPPIDEIMSNNPESGASSVSGSDIPSRSTAALGDGRSDISSRGSKQLPETLNRDLAEYRYSRPTDVDDLDARLQEALNRGANHIPRALGPPRLRSPTVWGAELAESILNRRREEEVGAYHQLVHDGGRPLYPIDLLGDVSASFPSGPFLGLDNKPYYLVTRNADQYQELLRPWLDDIARGSYFDEWWGGTQADYPWGVFQRQQQRWVMFRRWQRDNRDLEEDDNGGFPAYLEAEKRDIKRCYGERAAAERLVELEADPSRLKELWDDEQRRRTWQRHYCREPDDPGVGFSDYVDATKRRLARHGFTRPFELNQDPEQQRKLETWIEYLSFEYWWLDQFMRAIECRKERGDKVSQELKDTGVLQPIETRTCARACDCATREEPEESMARPRSLIRRLGLLIDELRDAARDAARHLILLRWILAQIPLIEADLSRSENSGGLDRARESESTKRRLDGPDGDDSPRETEAESGGISTSEVPKGP